MKMSLREIFTDMITNFQEKKFKKTAPRDIRPRAVSGKIMVNVGVRRCGKSTLMENRLSILEEQGVPRENMVMINFADERLSELRTGKWNELYEAYYSMYPGKRLSETVYFCFDEIQTFQDWELFVERLRRDENCDIYLTGASAKLLSKEIHTALRGRSLSWELFPFSFGEYLTRKGIPRQGKGTTTKMKIAQAWNNYKQEGGFPEVYEQDKATRIHIHQDYFDTLLYRDIIDRYNISQPLVLRQLAKRMLGSIGGQFSVNKICNDFRSQGISVSKETILQYIEWLEDAYFLFNIPACTASVAERFKLMRKVYCVDHAMITSLCGTFSEQRGQLLENMVFIALRRISPEVYYYRTENGLEVDFLSIHPFSHEKILVQACANMEDRKTREREIRAAEAAMRETGITTSFVISDADIRQDISTAHGRIKRRSASQFLAAKDPWEIE